MWNLGYADPTITKALAGFVIAVDREFEPFVACGNLVKQSQ